MPKKFKGENSKAVDAKARKAEAEKIKQETKNVAAENALWVDDDKTKARKQQRKESKESKRLEQLEKKKALSELHDQEMAALKSAKPKPEPKVTRYSIELCKEKLDGSAAAERSKDRQLVEESEDLVENANRLQIEDEARTVDDAIHLLGNKEIEIDRHPEKRMKAAYQEFEDQRLPILKKENMNLRLSQLKQILKKEWQKSPSNPMNARLLAASKH